MRSQPITTPDHYLTYAFATIPTLEGELAGGLPSVIAAELNARVQKTSDIGNFYILSDDKESRDMAEMKTKIIAATTGSKPSEIFDIWFNEEWAYLHPDAHTTTGYDLTTLAEMYQGEYLSPAGSLDRITEHFEKYGPHR